MKLVFLFLMILLPQFALADAVIFSGNDVKALKYNLDLFGRSKLLGINVDPRAGAGVVAPLSSIGMDYLTGGVYFKVGPLATDWISATGAIYDPGIPDTFAGYDSTGLLKNIPGWAFDPNYFGANVNLNVDPPNTVSYTPYHNFNVNLVPTVSSPDNTNAIFQINANVDPSNTGFSIGANGLAVRNLDNGLRFQGSGANGSAQLFNNYLDLGGSSIAGSVNGASLIDTSLLVRDAYTLGPNAFTAMNAQIVTEVGSSVPSGTNGYSLSYNVLGNWNSGTGGTNSYSISGGIRPTNNPTGGYTGYGAYLQMDADFPYANIFVDNLNIGPNVAVSIPNYTSFQVGPQLYNGSTITTYQGMNISPTIQSGSTVSSYVGLNIGQNINAGATVTDFKGLSVTAANYKLASGFYGTAIESQGFHNFNNPIDFPSGYNGFLTNANYMGGQFNILSGSPVTGLDAFGNNFAWGLNFADDVGPGSFGLGVSVVGFVGQVSGAPGKTFTPDYSFAVGGASVPPTSTGGTMSGEVAIFKAIGLINAGGTVSVTNQTSFLMPATFGGCGYATNCWGVKIAEPVADNAFAKNVIVGAMTPTNASAGLELNSTTKAFIPSRMTTAQRVALTAVNGMIVYDTTLSKQYCYEGGSWKPCIPTSLPSACPVRAVSSADTASSADCQIHGTGNYVQTLYVPADGDAICVKNAGSGTISLAGGGALIDDETSQSLYGKVSLCLYGYGGNWWIK